MEDKRVVKSEEIKVTEKKKVSLKKVKVSKGVKFWGFSILGLVGVLIICDLINIIFPKFGTFIWFNIRNPFYEVVFEIFEGTPRIGANIQLVLVPLVMLFALGVVLAENTRFFKYKNRVKIVNGCLAVIFLLGFGFFLPSLLDGAYLNAEKLNVLYSNKEVINKEYTKDDLVNLNNLLVDKIILMADTFERKDGAIVFDEDLVDLSISELENSSSKYKYLRGKYPNNVSDFSEKERKTNFDMTLGYTGIGGVVIDSYANDVEEINTIMHEMCHVKGIIRESEAEYCAFLASVDSSDERVVYSSYIAAFARTSSALSDIDEGLANDAEERFLNLCYEKGYEEACRFNIKNIDFYFDDADVFYGRGYKFKNYGTRKDELFAFLNKLDKYDLKVYVDDKNVSLNKISKLIDSGSEKLLYFSIEITEDEFDDIEEILKEYKTFFVAGYQNDSSIEEEEEDDRTSEELLEYYLKPFDKTDYSINEDYADEYYYERATRFYLEYFDSEL